MRPHRFVITAIALSVLVGPLVGQEKTALVLVKTIPLPGIGGRFDHFALDIPTHRLFVAALGNNTLEVVDPWAGARKQSLVGLGKPTGVIFLPDRSRLFVACGDDGVLRVFDGPDFRPSKGLGELADADNMRLDAKEGLIYLGYGAGALAVVRASTAEKTGDIKLAAHPESFQLEKDGVRIYINVPDANEVAVADRERLAVIATWPMKEFRANFPMALNEEDNRLFIGCREPARLVVLDTETGRKVTDIAISGDTDDLFYDAARHRLYASCGEGFIDVIARRDTDRYERAERIPTSPGARTSYFSPELGEYFLAVPERGSQKAEIRVFKVN